MSHYWIKLYSEILDDPKMGRLPDHLFRRVIEIFLIAGDNQQDGKLSSVIDMAWKLRTTEADLENDLQAIADQAGIVEHSPEGWRVVNFAKRQGPSSEAERMQRYRDRQHKQQYYSNGVVTNRNGGNNNSLVDTESDTESESDKNRADVEADAEADVRGNGNGNGNGNETFDRYLFRIFSELTRIPIPTPIPEDWYRAMNTLLEIGATDTDIRRAVYEMRNKNYKVYGLPSIVVWVQNNKRDEETATSANQLYAAWNSNTEGL